MQLPTAFADGKQEVTASKSLDRTGGYFVSLAFHVFIKMRILPFFAGLTANVYRLNFTIMKKVGEILTNSVENLFKNHFRSDAWKMAGVNKESLDSLSVDELRHMAFELSCAYIDVVHGLSDIKAFVKFVRDNKEVQD